MTKEERQKVLDKYDGHCAYCGCEIDLHTMQVDHIRPILRGWKNADDMRGADDTSNYNPSCAACNRRKGTLDIGELRIELEQCHQRMLDKSANYRQLVRYGQIQLVNDGNVEFYFEKYNKGKQILGL